MPRSIRTLKPQEVLALGIAVESRNAERYDTFAHIFTTYSDEASSLFAEMRDEELEHRKVLLDLYRSRFGDQPREVEEADVDEVVEAVDIQDAEHLVFNDVTRRNVLEAALRAEEGARRFYNGLIETERDAELLALFRRLAAFEDDHVAAVQQRLRRLDETKGGHA